MIEWIGIIYCSSVISCMCSLLATTFCLSATGGRLRSKLKRRVQVKDEDGSSEHRGLPDNKEICEVEKTFRGKSPPDNVVLQSSPWLRSNSDFEKNKSRKFVEIETDTGEFPSSNIEIQPINISKEELKNLSPSYFLYKNAKGPTSGCCDVTSESEINKTIDDSNTVFQNYNEFISRNTRQDLNNKIPQSSVPFEIPYTCKKTTNQGTMTVPHDFQVFDSKVKSKIKKCKCNKKGFRKNESTQSFRSMRSCTCSLIKSKSDLHPERTTTLKNCKSISTIKFSRDSKHRLTSKTSWISKTMRRLRFKNR
ncbi:uncharacterized protein LOC117167555 [Belonocnema kinseyi]|uniref:uncharacterized protein LOC117167555 n=1 Tax=Belonocnema kinseyi TaxID=2817044 RepID=UPI00143D7C6B|nr:uncharacterized protein LOC117167555 [Belonocnema kinseyi]